MAVIAVVAGTFFAVTGYLDVAGPSSTVESYFAELASGNVPAALGYGEVPAGVHSYLTSAVLRDQLSVAGISSVHARPGAGDGVQRLVDVSYDLDFAAGRQQVSDSIPVVRVGGKWRLAASAVSTDVSLSAADQRATLAGAGLPSSQVELFPGALPLRFDTRNLELPSGEGVVRFAGSTATDLSVQLSPTGTGAIDTAVAAALASCLGSATPAALCPVPDVAVRAVPASLHGRLVPNSLSVQATVQPDSIGVISLSGGFRADGSYQALDYSNQVSAKSGTFQVTFQAQCYATSPTAITWASQ